MRGRGSVRLGYTGRLTGIVIAARILIIAILLMARPLWGPCFASERPPDRVVLELFFEDGCESCAEVRRTVLPDLEQRYAGCYELRERDIGVQSNYLALVRYQELAAVKDNEPVSMVVDGRDYLPGVARIKAGLFPAMDRAITRLEAETVRGGSPAGMGAPSDGTGVAGEDATLLRRRIDQFTLVGVISAAAVDSINPCAISAIIFFMSLLSAARVGVSRMWISGVSFLVACFVTYLGIGFGLLKALGYLTAFQELRGVVDVVMIALLSGFAFYSFRDAFRYHRTGRASDVALKLPGRLQGLIHRVMKRGLRTRHLILGGLAIGLVVTGLESVCTGQVYVPALVMMLKSGQSLLWCTIYLVVYNVVFIMPLLVVLVLTCAGLKTPVLVEWSRRNVVTSKILLGLLFVGMILLMVWFR